VNLPISASVCSTYTTIGDHELLEGLAGFLSTHAPTNLVDGREDMTSERRRCARRACECIDKAGTRDARRCLRRLGLDGRHGARRMYLGVSC
jgi:hypothetical protein